MIDKVSVTVKGGHGGSGGISFVRRPGLMKPPPDGGNGGRGGSVFLVGTRDRNTLIDFRFQKNFQGKEGQRGNTNNKTGGSGEDLYLRVPLGTQVYWLGRLIADLDHEGEELLLAKGGRGGRGNIHLRTREDRFPHFSDPGEEGEFKEVDLELKVLADVGIIGLPNAGKSTLLGRLTAAHPKVGAYPFTTIDPNLGVMTWKGVVVVLADIPGLIEGAAEGKGLGHQFLKHLERTKLLVHLTTSIEDYRTIRSELASFDPKLLMKKEVIVLSKADTISEQEIKDKLKQFRTAKLKPVLTLSAITGEGLDLLRDQMITSLSK